MSLSTPTALPEQVGPYRILKPLGQARNEDEHLTSAHDWFHLDHGGGRGLLANPGQRGVLFTGEHDGQVKLSFSIERNRHTPGALGIAGDVSVRDILRVEPFR